MNFFKHPLAVLLLFCVFGSAYALDGSGDTRGDGLVVTLDMSVDAFNLVDRTFAHPGIRRRADQNRREIQYFISNWEFARDAQASLEYSADSFGGKFAFQPQTAGGSWAFGARIYGWMQFNVFRFTMGNDIERLYTDLQGSDFGMMIYSRNGWENPDNITNSNGLMAEALFNPLSVALAAGDYSSVWAPTGRIQLQSQENLYMDRFNTTYRYGARVGYEFTDYAKANVSYKIYHRTVADSYDLEGADSAKIVPMRADARSFDHVFGLFGSVNFASWGLSFGYLGAVTAHLREFFNSASPNMGMAETAIPVNLRNGIALHGRWFFNEKLILRTEHGVTFWQDKNYENFLIGRDWDFNTERKALANQFAVINNIFTRNAVGASYGITGKLTGGLYLRNIFSYTGASGNLPGGSQQEFIRWTNESRAELSLSYSFHPNASAFISFNLNNTAVFRSEDLNTHTADYFIGSARGAIPVPVETLDNVFSISAPVGFTLRMR